MSQDLIYRNATELKALILAGEISPVEVVEASLARLEEVEPTLNAFATITPEIARKSAKTAESRILAGEDPGSLAGLPFSIKDLLPVKGLKLTFGSRAMADNVADVDAVVYQRLCAAGASLVGKTATDEFGHKVVGNPPLSGQVRNPWNLGKTPGGSSAGAAVSVATGVTPFAVGTDGGGSLRLPGSFTGIFAIKPQLGRVPVMPVPLAPPLFHAGPMARSVRDAALMLQAMAGYDARDPFSVAKTAPDFLAACDRPIEGLRIAWSPTLGFAKPDAEVVDITSAAARLFETLGCQIEQVDEIFEADPFETWKAEAYAGGGTRLKSALDEKPDQFDPAVRAALLSGLEQSVADQVGHTFHRYALRERLHRFFETFDLLMTPAVVVPPFDVGRDQPPQMPDASIISWAQFGYPFNLTGNPAATVPAGFTADGLPVGLQIVAPFLKEVDIFRAAASFEAAQPWADRRPAIA